MMLIFVFILTICTSVNCELINYDFSIHTMKYVDLDNFNIIKENLPSEKWFAQLLDHYNSSEMRIWQQRYFMNANHYEKGGPIFLIVSGEWTANPRVLVKSYVVDLAKKFSAMCFLLEHRYYGMSQPLGKLVSVEDLMYLNSEQALMDTVYFINKMRSTYNITSENKWILFGSSYAGSLVTWMRFKYPHLVYGAVSQSAPLVAKVNYPEFYSVVHNTMKNHSEVCFNAVTSSFKQFYTILRDTNGRKKLINLFNFCHPFEEKTITEQLSNIYAWFLEMLIYIVSNRYITIDDACAILTDEFAGTPLKRLAVLNQIMLEQINQTCLPPKNMQKENNHVLVRWAYQTCTEFGWYQTTAKKPFNLFSETIAMSSFLDQCIHGFGSSFLQTLELGVDRTNYIYGNLGIIDEISNIVFIHGSNDPWLSAGITHSTNKKAQVIIIEGAGHTPLSSPPIEDYTNEIDKATHQLRELVDSWLKNK